MDNERVTGIDILNALMAPHEKEAEMKRRDGQDERDERSEFFEHSYWARHGDDQEFRR